MKRREFLHASLAAGLSAAALGVAADEGPVAERLPTRPYGPSREPLSIVGLGGIVVAQTEQAEADRIVAEAVEAGVNYFDVAPSYGDAQDRLGPALEPFRDGVFLACKSARRDGPGCREELEVSLRTLRTDHFDLYQLHGLATLEDLEQSFAPGGAMEVLRDARERGLTRHLGFSAHSEEVALRAMERFAFDSVLFPLNCVCMERGAFGHGVLEAARQRGISVLALKAMAWRPWPEGAERPFPKCWYEPTADETSAALAVRYTLDLGVTAIVPPGDAGLFSVALRAARAYRPLTAAERARLLTRLEGVPPIFGTPG